MEDYKYIEILIEDESGKIVVKHIMDKYTDCMENISYRIHSFKGIGKIPLKAKKMSQVKSKRLLTDLPQYLKGIDSYLKGMPGKKAIFVVLDCDDEDCVALKKALVQMYDSLEISMEVFFCIAIEEMEAWLLGDNAAVLKAYPSAKRNMLQKYVQDSIVGTWECLADSVYRGGLQALKRNGVSYYEIGKFKCECADNIGKFLDIRRNASPSFNYFIGKLDMFCNIAT